MTECNAPPREYVLGHESAELHRLQLQSRFLGPMTRSLLDAAGVRPGMRVVDIGCGAGDAGFLLAEKVGDSGEVIGIDRGESALLLADKRAKAAGLSQIRFLQGDENTVATLGASQPFDAIVGRFVLLHQPKPAAFVRTLATALRPGGLLIFQDPDYSLLLQTRLAIPLVEQVRSWIISGHRAVGVPTDISFRTPDIFREASLPLPQQRLVCSLHSPPHGDLCDVATEFVRGIQPFLVKQGVTSAAEIDIDTLSGRLSAELHKHSAVVQSLCLAEAWLRLP